MTKTIIYCVAIWFILGVIFTLLAGCATSQDMENYQPPNEVEVAHKKASDEFWKDQLDMYKLYMMTRYR